MEHKVLGKKVSQLEYDAKNMELDKIEKKLNLVDALSAYRILCLNDKTLASLKQEIKSYSKLKKIYFKFEDMEKYPNLSRLAIAKFSRILDYGDSMGESPRRDGIYSVPVHTRLPLSYFKELIEKNLFDEFLEHNTFASHYDSGNYIKVADLQETITIFDFEMKFGKQMEEQKIKYGEKYNFLAGEGEHYNHLSFFCGGTIKEEFLNLQKAIKFLSNIKVSELNNIEDAELINFVKETKKMYNKKILDSYYIYEKDGKKVPLIEIINRDNDGK